MGRKVSIICKLHIDHAKAYFNGASVRNCKIEPDTYVAVTYIPKKRLVYFRFNTKEKGLKCGVVTRVHQSQVGMMRQLKGFGLTEKQIVGVYRLKKTKNKKKKRTWFINLKKNLKKKGK